MNRYRDNQEMDWNTSIEDDGEGRKLLPPGEYNGRIVWVERGRFSGGRKIPPCNKAVVTIRVDTPDGPVELDTQLLLHKSLEWKLSSFFRAVGRKKPGERMVMSWDGLIGLPIRVHIGKRKYGKDGEEHICSDIDRFIDYDPQNFPADPDWLREAEQAEEEPFDEVF